MSLEIIEKFYASFQKKDWSGMQACYHDEVVFNDPVFRNLKGKKAKAMWHMLVAAGKNLTITYKNITANEQNGSCHWEAVYDFSRTGRKVHNIIEGNFIFKDGKIIEHTDIFNLWRWSRMALGTPGLLLGWSPFVRSKIRFTAEISLAKFIKEHPEYA